MYYRLSLVYRLVDQLKYYKIKKKIKKQWYDFRRCYDTIEKVWKKKFTREKNSVFSTIPIGALPDRCNNQNAVNRQPAMYIIIWFRHIRSGTVMKHRQYVCSLFFLSRSRNKYKVSRHSPSVPFRSMRNDWPIGVHKNYRSIRKRR